MVTIKQEPERWDEDEFDRLDPAGRQPDPFVVVWLGIGTAVWVVIAVVAVSRWWGR